MEPTLIATDGPGFCDDCTRSNQPVEFPSRRIKINSERYYVFAIRRGTKSNGETEVGKELSGEGKRQVGVEKKKKGNGP